MGFFYREMHTHRDLGLRTKIVSRPVMPPLRSVTETLPGRDGMLDFSVIGGRQRVDDKVLEIEIGIIGRDNSELNEKLSRIGRWLGWKKPHNQYRDGYEPLIFDDMPYIKWMVRPVNLNSSFNELFRVYKTTLQFRCKPFNFFLYDSSGIPLDSAFPLDSKIPVGYGEGLENIAVDSAFAQGKTVSVMNYGAAPVLPVIDLIGSFSAVRLESYSGYCQWNGQTSRLRIDGVNGTVTSGDQNMMQYFTGDFIELEPGMNQLETRITGMGQMKIWYETQFFYGEVFE